MPIFNHHIQDKLSQNKYLIITKQNTKQRNVAFSVPLGNPNRKERDIEIHSEEEINPLIQQEQQIDTRDSPGVFSINCILLNLTSI